MISSLRILRRALFCASLAATSAFAADGPPPLGGPSLTLRTALDLAFERNPRLTAAGHDVRSAEARRVQAGLLPNPETSIAVENAFGSGQYRGTREAETSVQLSQLIELGGKRETRVGAAEAAIEAARLERESTRLEISAQTAFAFVTALGAQRRVSILERRIAALDKLMPALRRRVEAGASSPAETARGQVAVDLARSELDRSRAALGAARRSLAASWSASDLGYGRLVGDLERVGTPPPLAPLLEALNDNPRLARWAAVRAQRTAEFRNAQAQAVPDLRVGIGGRHFSAGRDNAVLLSIGIPIPVFNRNQGAIAGAQQSLAKTEAERQIDATSLTREVGEAYETLLGARTELGRLREAVLPTARRALETIRAGYDQGRFSLLELLDAQGAVSEAELREQDALVSFHTSVATIEGLTGRPLALVQEKTR